MRIVIFANGELLDPKGVADDLAAADLLVAANGGTRLAGSLGVKPHVVVGDLDSVSDTHVGVLEALGVLVVRHPKRKDRTDLELAMMYAHAQGATDVVVVAGMGKRWDQTLANFLLPGAASFSGMSVRFTDGRSCAAWLRDGETLHIGGPVGATVSLLPLQGPAEGVTTAGPEYPLDDADLASASTVGVSNVTTTEPASVSVRRGLLVCLVSPSGPDHH